MRKSFTTRKPMIGLLVLLGVFMLVGDVFGQQLSEDFLKGFIG